MNAQRSCGEIIRKSAVPVHKANDSNGDKLGDRRVGLLRAIKTILQFTARNVQNNLIRTN